MGAMKTYQNMQTQLKKQQQDQATIAAEAAAQQKQAQQAQLDLMKNAFSASGGAVTSQSTSLLG